MLPRPDFPKHLPPLGKAVRILLLEDDPISVEIVGTYLHRIAIADSELHSAATLLDALALLAQADFDLVIADLHLPDSSGAATIEALVRAVGCPVIAITSDRDSGLRDATLSRGAYEFLQKDDLTEATLTRLVRLAAMQARTFRSLRESEVSFRSLSALTSDWFWETDAEHCFVTMPTRVTAVTGLGPQAYVGRPRWEVPGLAPVSADWTAHQQVLARRESFRDFQLLQVRADGSRCYLQISGEPVYDADGSFKGYRGTAQDVTARCRAEEALRASERRMRAIMDNDPQCVKLLDGEGRLIDMNPAGLRMIEADRIDPLRGQCVYGLVASEHRAAFRDLTQRVARGEEGALEFEIIGLKGTRRWLETRAVPLRDDASGTPLVLGITRDVTERRAAEAALRESEARFRTLTELTSDWYWEQDAELRFVSTGGASDARGGITPQAHVGLRRWELPHTEIVGQSWDEHRRILEARQPFTDLLLRRTPESGEARYVSVAGQPIFDAGGAFAGYRGVAKDVTTRIASELALRRFRAGLDAAGDMVFLVDARTSTYLDFNQTACRTLGYAREEMLGMETHAVRLDRTREELLEDYRALGAAPGTSTISVGTYRRKDGSTFPVEVTRRLLETSDGAVVVATARDLTERMHAERAQAAHLRYQERVTRFGQAALIKSEPAEVVGKAVQAVLEALGAEAVAYLEAEPGGGELVLRAVVGLADAGAYPGAIACGRSEPLRQVMVSGTRLVTDGAKLPLAWAHGLRSAALVPVRSDENVRGALCVCYKAARRLWRRGAEFRRGDGERAVDRAAAHRQRGAAGVPRAIRPAHRPAQPHAARRPLHADDRAGEAPRRRRSRCCSSTWTNSRWSTIPSATPAAMPCSRRSRCACNPRCAPVTRWRASAATNSRSCSPTWSGRKTRRSWRRRSSTAWRQRSRSTARKWSSPPASASRRSPPTAIDAEALLGAADAAMYRAKQSGRNAYQFYTAEINQRSRARSQMGSDLRRALEREEFALVYQPKYELADAAAERRRSAAALEASGARHGHARGIHPGARGNRAHRRRWANG